MNKKILQEETMELMDDDYKSAIKESYRRRTSEFSQFESTYKSWSQSTQIYALSKADGTGRPVLANIKAYNETIKERKKLAIMMQLLKKEISFLENFWINKGFDIEELKRTTKTKELVKTHLVTKEIGRLDTKSVAANDDSNENSDENQDNNQDKVQEDDSNQDTAVEDNSTSEDAAE